MKQFSAGVSEAIIAQAWSLYVASEMARFVETNGQQGMDPALATLLLAGQVEVDGSSVTRQAQDLLPVMEEIVGSSFEKLPKSGSRLAANGMTFSSATELARERLKISGKRLSEFESLSKSANRIRSYYDALAAEFRHQMESDIEKAKQSVHTDLFFADKTKLMSQTSEEVAEAGYAAIRLATQIIGAVRQSDQLDKDGFARLIESLATLRGEAAVAMAKTIQEAKLPSGSRLAVVDETDVSLEDYFATMDPELAETLNLIREIAETLETLGLTKEFDQFLDAFDPDGDPIAFLDAYLAGSRLAVAAETWFISKRSGELDGILHRVTTAPESFEGRSAATLEKIGGFLSQARAFYDQGDFTNAASNIDAALKAAVDEKGDTLLDTQLSELRDWGLGDVGRASGRNQRF